MLSVLAEIKPSDILLFIMGGVVTCVALYLAVGLVLTMLQPFWALLTGGEVSEDAITIWFWIFVAAAIVGLLYWQFS